MASRRRLAISISRRCSLEEYAHGKRNEAGRSAVGAADLDAVVTRLDEGLEARAQRDLDAATDIPPEVILRAGTATTGEARARTIKTGPSDRVRREGHAQRKLVHQISRERG